MKLRAVAIIDGEHYPSVVRSAIETLASEYDIAAAAFAGGTEKLAAPADEQSYGVPVVTGRNPARALQLAIELYYPEVVLDLSDEPVLSAPDRMQLASLTLARGVAYRGADFAFTPPPAWLPTRTPMLAIIGTGKRIGKTAISAFIARYLKDTDRDVVILAMGRGGPEVPELIRGEQVELTTEDLIELAARGVHAASDNYEDAVMSRVTTVGCRRCGGGLAGATFVSNVAEGAGIADALGKDLIIAEGSGAAAPPVLADATVLVAGAARGREYLTDYFGPYRMQRADALVITGAEAPLASPEEIDEMVVAARALRPDIPIALVTFRPRPLSGVGGRKAFFATTAPAELVPMLSSYLEGEYGCEVVASSNALSDRERLREDLLRVAGRFDVLISELKAAAVDVVATAGAEAGVPTVFCDNEPIFAGGNELSPMIEDMMRLVAERYAARSE